MKELEKLVTDLDNINAPLVKATIDLDGLADRYDDNKWLKSRLLELEDDLDKIIAKLTEIKHIYDFKGGE